jgi:invasion protein IalB
MVKRITIACLLILSTQAFAQENAPEPSETTEKFGAWTVRCVNQQGDAGKACEVALAVQGQGGLIAQIAVGNPKDGDNPLIVGRTPLGVLVSEPVTIVAQGDEAAKLTLPFVTCLANGCLAQASVSGDDLGKLAARDTGAVTFAERTGRKVQINIPLAGLTDALTRIGLDCGSGSCKPAE